MLYAVNTFLKGNKVKEAWFIVIPSRHIEQGFSNHIDYIKFLDENGINVEPKLYDINYVSEYFDNHYPINWKEIGQ